ncbi:MAG: efflux RND transporter periplasmic adaptor subunit [Gemmatimonadales bacterium]|jgi:multidrug efflux system membrane fusion protein
MASGKARRTARWLGATAAVLLLAACAKKASGPRNPTVPVTLTVARRQAVPYTIVASGLVTPSQTAIVSPQVDGIISNVAFHEGDDVARDQPLFQIEPQPYQAAYLQAVAVLARDRVTAQNAKIEADRYVLLAQSSFATPEQAQQERATADAATAQVSADSAAVVAAKFNLDKTVIRAPIGGRTGSLLVHEGNLVHAAGSTALVTITQLHPIDVRFAVPSSALPLIQQYGAHGGLRVVASYAPTQSASDSSADSAGAVPALQTPTAQAPGAGPPSGRASTAAAARAAHAPAAHTAGAAPTDETGMLTFIDNAVDTTTSTVMLKATFANPTRTLWPGQFVSVLLRLFTEEHALVLPTQAVLTGQQGSYVYVVDSTGAAQPRSVTVERTAGTLAIIQSGLREGEKVVAEGQSRLTAGAKVSLPAADSARAKAPAGARPAGGRRGA